MEDSGGSALGDVHFSAQSSKKLCCNRCVLKYDKMQVGTKEFENMQPGVKMIIRRIGGAKSSLFQVNSGSGLTPEEGIFKAPREGNYYFQFHGLVQYKQSNNMIINSCTGRKSTRKIQAL